ncbi:helix-turn-helix transcriptional regulator [Actinomadura sp. 3N407]|uniref:helix-turn-helix transcriptional regulator n=1 Tax=Actinomadura sp. 3N407 TaxID=3457423 RepID=UPI003FCDACC2
MTVPLVDELRARVPLPTPAEARRIREAAEVTQERMAEELGVHRVTVARWEDGTRRPRGKTRDAYATLLAELRKVIA